MCDSKRYVALPVLTHAISNTGGFGEFGEYYCSAYRSLKVEQDFPSAVFMDAFSARASRLTSVDDSAKAISICIV